MDMATLLRIVLVGGCLAIPISPSYADNQVPLADEVYEQEVKKFVRKPCEPFLAKIETAGTQGMMELLKKLEEIHAIPQKVRGLPLHKRKTVYEAHKQNCEQIAQKYNSDASSQISDEAFSQEVKEFVMSPLSNMLLNSVALVFKASKNPDYSWMKSLTADELVLLAKSQPGVQSALIDIQQALEEDIIKRYKGVKSLPKETRQAIYKLERRKFGKFKEYATTIQAKAKLNLPRKMDEEYEAARKMDEEHEAEILEEYTEREEDEDRSEILSGQIRLDAPADSVPAHIKEKALQNCKRQYQALDKFTGSGWGSSWTMLKLCVDSEIRSYQDFRQEYGE